jgi:hypothetical protein
MRIVFSRFFFCCLLIVLFSCKKQEEVVFENNNIPPYSEVPTLLVENYVNRLYIDLIGREPNDVEMSTDVTGLESNDLSVTAREALVDKLMFSTAETPGDSSYTKAYFRKIYEDHKARFLNGSSEADLYEAYGLYQAIAFQDSLNGNMLSYEVNMGVALRVKNVIDSRTQLLTDAISIDEMCRRMCNNTVYDDINMNTFNFINASFDDLFFRFPTESELDQAYAPIDYNGSGVLFGQVINNKNEYLDVLTHSAEFAEGMVRWAYLSLLSREPSSAEIITRLTDFNSGQDIQKVQKKIVISDEYAGF